MWVGLGAEGSQQCPKATQAIHGETELANWSPSSSSLRMKSHRALLVASFSWNHLPMVPPTNIVTGLSFYPHPTSQWGLNTSNSAGGDKPQQWVKQSLSSTISESSWDCAQGAECRVPAMVFLLHSRVWAAICSLHCVCTESSRKNLAVVPGHSPKLRVASLGQDVCRASQVSGLSKSASPGRAHASGDF